MNGTRRQRVGQIDPPYKRQLGFGGTAGYAGHQDDCQDED